VRLSVLEQLLKQFESGMYVGLFSVSGEKLFAKVRIPKYIYL